MFYKNRIEIQIKSKLTEQGDTIISKIEENKKILLMSGMSTGKTYFTANTLANYFNNKEIKVLFVAPTNALIDQFMGDYGDSWKMTNSKLKAPANAMRIITTPDSLPKEIEKCEEVGKKFLLVIDEAHETQGSMNFRPAFNNILVSEKHELCISSLHLSATPGNILLSPKSKDIDLFIEVKQPEELRFWNAENFILKSIKMDTLNIVQLLKESLESGLYTQIFFKVDSHEKLEEIKQTLDSLGIEGHTFLTSKNKDENDLYELIKKKKIITPNYKIIGLTSFVNAGVEIMTEGSVLVINFTNKTFNYMNEVQFIGRFRNGVKDIITTIPIEEEEEETTESKFSQIFSYTHFYQKAQEKALIYRKCISDLGKIEDTTIEELKDIASRCPIKCLKLDEISKECSIDETLLSRHAHEQFRKQYLKKENRERLLNLFKQCPTLKIDNYHLQEEPTKIFNMDVFEKVEEVKNCIKLREDIKKQEFYFLAGKVSEEKEEIIEEILKNNILNLENDYQRKLSEQFQEALENYETARKLLRILRECELTQLKAFKFLIDKGESKVQEFKKEYTHINLLKNYLRDKELLKEISKDDILFKRFYKTMEYIEPRFKNGKRISEQSLEQLGKIYKSLGINIYKKKQFYVIKKQKDNAGNEIQIKKYNTTLRRDVINYLKLFCNITETKGKERASKTKVIRFSSFKVLK